MRIYVNASMREAEGLICNLDHREADDLFADEEALLEDLGDHILAQTLLLESQLNVSQIAAEVGFSDPAYFIRLFKRHIGFTPQEYRQCLIG